MKFSELKKGMLLCYYHYGHTNVLELVYIKRIDIDRVSIIRFITHQRYEVNVANVTRRGWASYKWTELRLAKYIDVKFFIKNAFEV